MTLRATRFAPLNCPEDQWISERCPECNQFHLRPGYCQARSPEITAAILAQGKAEAARAVTAKPRLVTDSELVTATAVTDSLSVTDSAGPVTARACAECGDAMPETARGDARYCSAACRVKSSRRRSGEA